MKTFAFVFLQSAVYAVSYGQNLSIAPLIGPDATFSSYSNYPPVIRFQFCIRHFSTGIRLAYYFNLQPAR